MTRAKITRNPRPLKWGFVGKGNRRNEEVMNKVSPIYLSINDELRYRLINQLRGSQSSFYPSEIEGVYYLDTHYSENPNLSRNGGDYDFWLTVTVKPEGVYVIEECSCDFWQPQDEPDFYEGATIEDLHGLIEG